jgi:hypothetical protein
MGYLQHWVRVSLRVLRQAVAGGGKSEVRSCPTPAPRYPSFPAKSCYSSDPRALARSRSFSGFRVRHLSVALLPTMSRCSLECAHMDACACSAGPVPSLAAGGGQDSSSAQGAARGCRATCLQTPGGPIVVWLAHWRRLRWARSRHRGCLRHARF